MEVKWPVVEINILHPDDHGAKFVVGTYYNDGRVSAYSRDFSPDWPTFEEYRVIAKCGADAKRAAIRHRTQREKKEGRE